MPYLSTRKNLAVFVSTFIAGSALLMGETPSKAGDVSGLFEDAKTTAAMLKRDVIEMESFARSSVSWRSHADQIHRITEHVNKAGQIAAQLEQSRGKAEAWHQNAIDRVTPLLKELASNIQAMIEHINKQKNMTDPTYIAYLKTNETLAGELSNLISETVEYDKTKGELMKAEQGKLTKG